VRQRHRTVGDLPAEAALALDDDQLRCHVLNERVRVAARRRQHGHEVAGMGPLDVVPRAAVIPDQQVEVGADVPRAAHQVRRIRTEDQVAPSGQVGKY